MVYQRTQTLGQDASSLDAGLLGAMCDISVDRIREDRSRLGALLESFALRNHGSPQAGRVSGSTFSIFATKKGAKSTL